MLIEERREVKMELLIYREGVLHINMQAFHREKEQDWISPGFQTA